MDGVAKERVCEGDAEHGMQLMIRMILGGGGGREDDDD
jgi:hypothetical protein